MRGLNITQIKKILSDKYPNIDQIVSINKGESSKAFSFTTQGEKLILRVNKSRYGFDKDAFFHNHFSNILPIPRVLEIGSISDKLYYSISEPAKGTRMDLLTARDRANAVEGILEMLDTMHAINPVGDGYGEINEVGFGECKSWTEKIKDDHSNPDRWAKVAKIIPF